jgi:hypothetical protein
MHALGFTEGPFKTSGKVYQDTNTRDRRRRRRRRLQCERQAACEKLPHTIT